MTDKTGIIQVWMEKKKVPTDFKKLMTLWLPPFLWMAVIFLFSSLSTPPVSKVYWTEFVIKKSAHVVEYFTLYLLWYRAFFTVKVLSGKVYILTLIVCIFYAISDEIHQSFTPGREPRIRDIAIDSGAALFSLFIIKYYLPKSHRIIRNIAKKAAIL